MPISFEIDEMRGFVLTTVTGRLGDEELLAHKKELLADPRFRGGMRELSDIRGVDQLDVTPNGIIKAASFDSVNSPSLSAHRLGLLVPTDFVFGMARMYQSLADGKTGGVEIFRDEEAARRWLESPE